MRVLCSLMWTEAAAQDCTSARVTAVGFSTPTSLAPASAHRARIVIEAPDGCPWTVVSNSAILAVVPPSAGAGNAEVPIDLAANPADARSGSVAVTVGTRVPQTFHMVQKGCLAVLSRPDFASVFPGYERRPFVDAAGGRRYVKVNPASPVCVWPAQSHVPWISVAPGNTGEGPGVLTYSVEPNSSGVAREGTLTVGYLTFTIRQSAGWAADLNGDAFPDLLWHQRNTGQVATWLMNGTQLADGRLLDPSAVPDTNWKVAGSGDFNQDGHPDLVWQHDDGRVAVWFMHLTTQLSGRVLTHQMFPLIPEWRIKAVLDLNSDGHPDLLVQHATTGAIAAWIMYQDQHLFDATITPSAVPDTDWEIVGAGDFNHDGQADLLWQNHASGLVSAWLLEWPTNAPSSVNWRVTSGTLLSPGQVSDTDWKIRGVVDIDRDGRPDLLWQHRSSGLIATWLMDGLTLRDGTLFSPGQVADTNWILAGPR